MKTVIIFDFNRTIYNPESAQLMGHSLEMLQRLSRKFHLILLGKGDEKRKKIITRLDIKKFFQDVYLVPEKNIDQLIFIKERFPKNTLFYSIGDQVKKEIMLGNAMGFKTIWFKFGKFASEMPETDSEKPWKIVNSLEDVEKIIMGY